MPENPVIDPKIQRLFDTAIRLLQTKSRQLGLTSGTLARPCWHAAPAPNRLPALRLLPAMAAQAGPETVAVVRALIDAAPLLCWRQTYEESALFNRTYLDRYGWFDLIGPAGPWQVDGFRLMAGYWGQGLVYPDHAHPPEEHYIVLAGGARFKFGDRPYSWLGPGQIFHTPPGAVHSADMIEGPLLALALWRGPDIGVRIDLTGHGREVVLD